MEENTLLLFQGELCAFVRIKKFNRPYNPQQNILVECKNRSLLEIAIRIASKGELPKHLLENFLQTIDYFQT